MLVKTEKTKDEYLFFKNLLSSAILYLIFVFTTRLQHKIFWGLIILMCFNFLIRSYMESLDPIIFKEKLENLEIWSDILVIISIIILIIGIILY